jgi:hypothetical protein
MLSVSLSPNVIKLSGFNRKSKFDKIVIARVLPKFGKSCANVQALFETQATSDRISQQQKKIDELNIKLQRISHFFVKKTFMNSVQKLFLWCLNCCQ